MKSKSTETKPSIVFVHMGATTVELKSSHVPMLSHPKSVIDVIRAAAKAVQGSSVMA